jgi:hypothetical protein
LELSSLAGDSSWPFAGEIEASKSIAMQKELTSGLAKTKRVNSEQEQQNFMGVPAV